MRDLLDLIQLHAFLYENMMRYTSITVFCGITLPSNVSSPAPARRVAAPSAAGNDRGFSHPKL